MLNYNNYHKHSFYSNVLTPDSVVSLEDYAKKAVELNQKILSSAEHGWCGNFFETVKIAKKYGLKPLIGAEAYFVIDRHEKDKTNSHIFIGAKNENGRKSLNDILSEANLTGFYQKPRIDAELLFSLPCEDVIITTACVGGVWRYQHYEDIIKELASKFRHFYLEVQANNVENQRDINKEAIRLSNKYKVPLIAGCDSHYINQNDAQTRSDFLLSKGISYPEEENWFLDYPSAETLYGRFANQCVLTDSQIREAMSNTKIFEDVEEYNSPIFNTDVKLPSLYPNYTQEQKDEEYKKLVWAGWDEYKKDIPEEMYPTYEKEIEKEIQVVVDTKMADYFILDYHIMKKGKENGGWLTKSGRGSATSFFTNTLLGFSDIDRIAATVHLYPERFMSKTRILESKTLPD